MRSTTKQRLGVCKAARATEALVWPDLIQEGDDHIRAFREKTLRNTFPKLMNEPLGWGVQGEDFGLNLMDRPAASAAPVAVSDLKAIRSILERWDHEGLPSTRLPL